MVETKLQKQLREIRFKVEEKELQQRRDFRDKFYAGLDEARRKQPTPKKEQPKIKPIKQKTRSRRPQRKRRDLIDSKKLIAGIGSALGYKEQGRKQPTPIQIMKYRERMLKLQLKAQKEQARQARLNAQVPDPYRRGFEDDSPSHAELSLEGRDLSNGNMMRGAPSKFGQAFGVGASLVNSLGKFAQQMGRQPTIQERGMIERNFRRQQPKILDDRGSNLLNMRNEFNQPAPNLFSQALNMDSPSTNIFKESAQRQPKILSFGGTNLL